MYRLDLARVVNSTANRESERPDEKVSSENDARTYLNHLKALKALTRTGGQTHVIMHALSNTGHPP